MKRFRLLGLALMVVFALAAVLSASASALPEYLELTNNKSFTGVAKGTSTLETAGAKKVECKKATGSGGVESDTLGTFHITFEECSSSGIGCTSKGDASGSILTLGSMHYVYDTLGTGETLGIAILFLPSTTEFECTGFAKTKVKGTVVCLILTPLTSSKTHEFHCVKGAKAGEQAQKHYWNDSGTIVNTQLLSELNGGAAEESNEQALSTFTTPLAGAWMNE